MRKAREELISAMSHHLRGRNLIWFGVRGKDANPLSCFEEFNTCFSIIAPSTLHGVTNHCLESITGVRVNVDRYDIDMDASPAAERMRRALCESLNQPCVLVPYRPLGAIDSAYFPRTSTTNYLGLFREFQRPFDHKIWVESQLRRLGVRTIPWVYLSIHEDYLRTLRTALSHRPIVLRQNISSGGAGLRIVYQEKDLEEHISWLLAGTDDYFAYSPYMVPSIPLSVSACAYPDGTTTVHAFSVQIIGDKDLSPYPLGFCGSDFGSVRQLTPSQVEELEAMTKRVGRWLASKGFIGAFGVDLLLFEEELFLTEVNPRFLGSSLMSAEIDHSFGLPDIYLSHMAAFLMGIPHNRPPLKDIYRFQTPCIQRVRHNISTANVSMGTCHIVPLDEHAMILQKAGAEIEVEHGGMLWKEIIMGNKGIHYGN